MKPIASSNRASDRRVSYAQLTEPGRRKFAEAGCDHRADIDALFIKRFTVEELDTLAELLGRLPGCAEDPAADTCS